MDGSAVTYTNWRQQPLQPNNGNNNQHCTQVHIYISTSSLYLVIYIIYNLFNIQVRPDGDWDDVICDKNQPYVCQKAARPRRFG